MPTEPTMPKDWMKGVAFDHDGQPVVTEFTDDENAAVWMLYACVRDWFKSHGSDEHPADPLRAALWAGHQWMQATINAELVKAAGQSGQTGQTKH